MSDPCGQGLCNVWTIPRLRNSMPPDAPGRRQLEPPQVPEQNFVVPAVLVVLGVAIATAGGAGIVAGLLLTGAGVAIGLGQRRQREAALAALAEWEASRWCVACDRRLGPSWSKPTETA